MKPKRRTGASKREPWNAADRRAFADGLRTRAQTFAQKKRETARLFCRKDTRHGDDGDPR